MAMMCHHWGFMYLQTSVNFQALLATKRWHNEQRAVKISNYVLLKYVFLHFSYVYRKGGVY